MANQLSFADFKGLVPGLDAKKINQPHVTAGRNFIVNADGVKSEFGNEVVSYWNMEFTQQLQSIRISGELFIANDFGVFSYNRGGGYFFPRYTLMPTEEEPFPWSSAFVGGILWFGRKGYNLISYNPNLNEWTEHPADAQLGIPEDIHAVTSSNGRLVILATGVIAWSAIDDGSYLITDPDRGSGAQSLSIVGYGSPLGIRDTADGFITYTTTGIVKSEAIDAKNPFRHYVLKDEKDSAVVPLDQFCIMSIANDVHVVLTRTGFYQTAGRRMEPWQPILSEHFTQNVFKSLDLSTVGLFKLSYSSERDWFIVSVALNETPFLYGTAYVKYLPKDEWGYMVRNHIAFGDFDVSVDADNGNTFGYICGTYYLRSFVEFPHKEIAPDPAFYAYFTEAVDFPAQIHNGNQVFSSYVHLTSYNRGDYGPNNGVFVQSTKEPAPRDLVGLDAVIEIGLFRLLSEQHMDHVGYVTNVGVGMLQTTGGFKREDWNIDGGVEDWNTGLGGRGDQDWGAGIQNSTEYQFEMIGSDDGYVETDVEIPVEVQESGTFRVFACNTTGWWHRARFSATELGEAFYLKFLQMTANLGGRM